MKTLNTKKSAVGRSALSEGLGVDGQLRNLVISGSREMEEPLNPQGIQRATSREPQESHCTTLQRQASFSADLPLYRADHHSVEDESRKLSFERAKVQRRRMRDESLESKHRQAYQDGAFAEFELSRHMRRSLPVALLAKQTTLRWFLFSIHRKASDIALRQAHRSVRRLGLKRVVDTKGFVSDHCGWYMTFCALSDCNLKQLKGVSIAIVVVARVKIFICASHPWAIRPA